MILLDKNEVTAYAILTGSAFFLGLHVRDMHCISTVFIQELSSFSEYRAAVEE